MDQNGKELTQEEMENARGGGLPVDNDGRKVPLCLTGRAYCRACHKEMATVGALYRCQTGVCEERGKDKTAAEVSWY